MEHDFSVENKVILFSQLQVFNKDTNMMNDNIFKSKTIIGLIVLQWTINRDNIQNCLFYILLKENCFDDNMVEMNIFCSKQKASKSKDIYNFYKIINLAH